MTIGSSHNFFPAQYLKNEWLLLQKKNVHIDVDKILAGIVLCQFVKI